MSGVGFGFDVAFGLGLGCWEEDLASGSGLLSFWIRYQSDVGKVCLLIGPLDLIDRYRQTTER